MAQKWRAPFASSEGVHQRMSVQRREGTAPEMALRRALHTRGLRYRLHRSPLPTLRRKADIVFGPARVAVFVDGCFWHGCPAHGTRKHEVNNWYWPDKIARNRARDADTDSRLSQQGWLAVRVWEHEVMAPSLAQAVAARLEGLVRERAASARSTTTGPEAGTRGSHRQVAAPEFAERPHAVGKKVPGFTGSGAAHH